ncbi:MAG: AraC family ligand binding domain-containing protein, partial [Bacteroidota bacterium]
MSKSIPEINFSDEQQSIEFEIFDNFELLFRNSLSRLNLFRPHRINFYAILYIIKGEGQHFIDFKSYDYRRGTIIFISREQVHRFVRNPNREAFFIIFTERFLENSSMGSRLMQQLSLYNYHFHHPILRLREEQMGVFTELIRRAKEEYKIYKDELTAEIMQSVLKIFLLMAERVRKSGAQSQEILKHQA